MNPRKWEVNLNHHIFTLNKSVETCHPVSLPCKGTSILIFVTCGASFYPRVWSVQPQLMILLPCVLAHASSIHMGAINFYIQERFLHWLIPLLFPCLWCIYMQECSVHSIVSLLFPWVQFQSFKPVLSQCSETSFVTVDSIVLYTRPHMSSIPMGAKYLYSKNIFYTHW